MVTTILNVLTMSTLNVTFTNNSTHKVSDISIGFVPGAGATFNVTNAVTGDTINPLNTAAGSGNWYSFSDFVNPKSGGSNGVNITNFSGRIYIAYGTTWSVQYAGYEPAQAVTDPNFFLRYDKVEMTFNGSASDVANLTSIDYWSIPISLNTYIHGAKVGGNSVSGLLGTTTAQDIYNDLLALTSPTQSGLTGLAGNDGSVIAALVPGSFVQYDSSSPAPGTAFARIIGPSSYPSIYPNQGIPVTPYQLFSGYLNNLVTRYGVGTSVSAIVPGLGNGTIATIAGSFAGVGPNVPATGPQSAQSYNLTATIDDSCNITLTGTIGSDTDQTMVFAVNDLLNPTGIYGGNSPFSLNGAAAAPPANDVYGWISGDLLSGLNIGAVGSSSTVHNPPSVPTVSMVGALSSQLWFTMPINFLYGNMQPAGNYNPWAATLQPLTQAYNFAYSDRFAHVFASLNPTNVDTLELVLEPDAIQM